MSPDGEGDAVARAVMRWASRSCSGAVCLAFLVLTGASAGGWHIAFSSGTDAKRCAAEHLAPVGAVGFASVCVHGGTEHPRSHPYDKEYNESGVYRCACCGQPLFLASAKFNSGTGWPSYWAPVAGGKVGYQKDAKSLLAPEVHCSRCGAHLGHLFDDGKGPTGLRYCINGVCLKYDPGTELPVEKSPPWVANQFLLLALMLAGCPFCCLMASDAQRLCARGCRWKHTMVQDAPADACPGS